MSSHTACIHCGKKFINVQEHITKSHKTNHIVMCYTEDELLPRKSGWSINSFKYEGCEFSHVVGSSNTTMMFEVSDEDSKRLKVGKLWNEIHVEYDSDGNIKRVFIWNKETGKAKELYIHTIEITKTMRLRKHTEKELAYYKSAGYI